MLDLLPAFLLETTMGKPLWMWGLFIGIVLFLLVLDLGVLHRKTHEVGVRESLWMSGFYIAIAMAFGGWVWYQMGAQAGMLYYTGFLIEKTLALDNIFVISLIFTYLAIPRLYQHRVLFWGILGVIVLRGIMIGAGAALVENFSWVLYIFAAFLIFTGVKMLAIKEGPPDMAENALLRFLNRRLRVTPHLEGQKFFTRSASDGRLWVTPLFIALILVEAADIIFAVDSVPAIFAITTDPYIIYTSNIFAILGLRALYFALAAIIHRFKYLKPAMALILVFIGSKIFLADMFGLAKFPPAVSLGVTVALLAGGIVGSIIADRKVQASS